MKHMLNTTSSRLRRGAAAWFAILGVVLATSLGIAGARHSPAPAVRRNDSAPAYEVYAIRYATVPGFRLSGLIAGADTSRRMDIAMMVWLIKGPDGRNILLDAGFHRDDFVRRWKPKGFMPPSEAVARAGVKPEDVTDVIISHIHWDHLDGIDLFPNARVWIQRDEFEHHLDSAGNVKDRAIDAGDAKILADIARQGRVNFVDGDAREIIPGVTVYTGGKHTFASQFATVHTAQGTVVLASDNMYLYENLATRRPIAQTLDSLSNLRAQARMVTLASDPRLIVPGHDPEVFVRFPEPGNGIARIH
ncbi:MAG TPA: N-acyl homoserine lactonase family protein [Gemmatimonadaceae bacterium]|jgi:glyoxylase-like metal-dependent hydrolase (beta-lactamase superfamily II)|nr:N-acyl homoserine lactonase family protein [Gemmatimonadaceae bacterium]